MLAKSASLPCYEPVCSSQLLLLAASGSSKSEGSVFERLKQIDVFSKFVEIVESEKGLRDELERQQVTVFVPTNEAFQQHAKETEGQVFDMKELIRYHVVPNERLAYKDMYAGRLLATQHIERDLKKHSQMIRINFYVHVEKHLSEEAQNGMIYGINHVLLPPRNALVVLLELAPLFSTAYTAICSLELEGALKKPGLTMFIPTNTAWKHLGMQNLIYLFSKQGEQDLIKILKYHISESLVYSPRMMEERHLVLGTAHGDESIAIEVTPLHSHNKEPTANVLSGENVPSKVIFSINHGQARVWVTDGLASNGVIHTINEVLIPKDVQLPHLMDAGGAVLSE
ncbi:FAS1 domain-containing protein [Zopfochytrium polystomum]|nr:FAS1 domain-containing protein [Zopfochytrium polystomum]